MLCSLNGLRSVKNHLFILSRQFRFFFYFSREHRGLFGVMMKHLKSFQQSATAGRRSHDNKPRGHKCPRPCASDSLAENKKKRALLPRGLPAEFVELVFCGFFWLGYMNPCRCSTKQRRVNIFATGFTRKRTYASERQLKKHLSVSVESFGATGF